MGLLAGGILTEAINWHWIFFINVPIAIVTAVLRRTPDGVATRASASAAATDVPGAVLITSSLMLGVYTIVKPAAEQGWTDSQTLLLSAVSLGAARGLHLARGHREEPADPARASSGRATSPARTSSRRSASPGCSRCSSWARSTWSGSSATTRSRSASRSCPRRSRWASCPRATPSGLVTRFGARRTLIPGLVLIMGSLALFTRAPVDGSWVEHVLPVMLLLGFGAGMAFPALMNLAMSDVEQSEAGLASGLVNTTAQVGAALGLAVLATLSASHSDDLIADGEATAQALTSGYHLAFWVGAALVLAAIVAALTVLKPDAAGGQEHAGELEASATEVEYSEAA